MYQLVQLKKPDLGWFNCYIDRKSNNNLGERFFTLYTRDENGDLFML